MKGSEIMSIKEVVAELKEINKKLDKLLDMFEAMKILQDALESWAKGKKVDFGGGKDSEKP